MALRTRNGAVLAKVESVEGTAETLSPSADAILVENIQINYNPQNTQTNEVTGSLDNRGPIVGGLQVAVSFDVYLKGSGAAGSAPEVAPLMKACGWAETITATAVPAAAEACGAGGSTTTAELGTTAVGTAQLYRGMPINFSSGITLSSLISDYTAGKVATLTDTASGTIDATSDYQIPVNVRYGPASTSIPTITIGVYQDGLLTTLAGVRGTFNLSCTAAGPGKFSFQFSGMFDSKADAAVPSATYDATRPPIWRGGKALVDQATAVIASMNINNGNTVTYPPNPNASQGFDPAVITERSITGTIDPQATLVATRDILGAMQAGTQQIIAAQWGTATGNQVGITIPTALYTGDDPGDRQGLMTEEVPFTAVGQDAGLYLTFF